MSYMLFYCPVDIRGISPLLFLNDASLVELQMSETNGPGRSLGWSQRIRSNVWFRVMLRGLLLVLVAHFDESIVRRLFV